MAKWGMETLPHPPFSPDLAPCDFSIFPKLKNQLRSHKFRKIEDMQAESCEILRKFGPEVLKWLATGKSVPL